MSIMYRRLSTGSVDTRFPGSAPGDRDRALAPRVSQQCVWSSIVACQCHVVASSSASLYCYRLLSFRVCTVPAADDK